MFLPYVFCTRFRGTDGFSTFLMMDNGLISILYESEGGKKTSFKLEMFCLGDIL